METEDMMNALFCEFPSFRCSDAMKTRDEMYFAVVLRTLRNYKILFGESPSLGPVRFAAIIVYGNDPVRELCRMDPGRDYLMFEFFT